MPTDPFVPAGIEDRPRQEQNLPPGIHLPAARAWRADRPGDVAPGWPEGTLLGSPGPNVGHALTIAHRRAPTMRVAAHESRAAATVVVGDLAMRRAALWGRAPVPADVDVAVALLGLDGSADADFAAWRAGVIEHAAEDYPTRRVLVDAVGDEVLLADPASAPSLAADARVAMRDAIG